MTPSEADARQKWAGMDAPTAWLLIERHADGWNDIREMLEAWARANRPAWHDAPTCAGLWLNNINGRARQISSRNITQGTFSDNGERWYGPILEDAK